MDKRLGVFYELWKAHNGIKNDAWEVHLELEGDRGVLSLDLLVDAANAHDALESAQKELPEDWETYWMMTGMTVKRAAPWEREEEGGDDEQTRHVLRGL